MTWEEKSANLLIKRFGRRAFSTEEAYAALRTHSRVKGGYSLGSIHHLLYALCKNKELLRLGRGLYAFPSSPAIRLAESVHISDKLVVDLIPGALAEAVTALKSKAIEFMATGPSVLAKYHHYVAMRLLHLIYVLNGTGEEAIETLRGKHFMALLNPSLREIELTLETRPEANIFIVREFSSLEGSVEGRALLERALVDSYFETTRRKIPFPEGEVVRIFANVFRNETISLSKLTMFARRRGIAPEIAAVFNALKHTVEKPKSLPPASAKHVTEFLSHLK
jgi:hypothetical protein